jgi:hypothetical protein
VSISAGAATGGSKAACNIEATLNDTRRQCDGSRRQVDRWALRWCEHSMCGWLEDGNSAGDDTRARSRGGLGEDDLDRWAPSVGDGGVVTGGKLAHMRRWAEGL